MQCAVVIIQFRHNHLPTRERTFVIANISPGFTILMIAINRSHWIVKPSVIIVLKIPSGQRRSYIVIDVLEASQHAHTKQCSRVGNTALGT